MSSPLPKRRRLDASANTLSKPFKSPLRMAQAFPASGSNYIQDHTLVQNISIPRNSPTGANSKVPSFRSRQLTTPKPLLAEAQLRLDPTIAPLLKTQRILEKQLKDVKVEIDAAEQARKIEKESGDFHSPNADGEVILDGELVELIRKWKGMARLAADELFGPIKDKINRAGGPKAWREAQAESAKFLEQYNEEPEQEPDCGDEGPDVDREECDIYAEYSIDPETENEKEARGVDDANDDDPEDEFTMFAMLRMLGLDPSIIGYDRDAQRWATE